MPFFAARVPLNDAFARIAVNNNAQLDAGQVGVLELCPGAHLLALIPRDIDALGFEPAVHLGGERALRLVAGSRLNDQRGVGRGLRALRGIWLEALARRDFIAHVL